MRSSACLASMFALAILGASTASPADYWDLATNTDNGIGTDNQLSHGTEQLHDLEANAGPVADQDWYALVAYRYSSYEAVIDSMSGDLDMYLPPENFQRLAVDGTTVLQTAEEADAGSVQGFFNRALRWEMGFSGENQFLRVQSAACGATCGPEDRYRIRFYETTVSVPRFNNGGGQTTVLIIQNTANLTRPLNGNAYFWTTDGNTFAIHPFSLFPARTALVLNTSTVAPGIGGTITIAHDGGYGGLAVKAVALEPATGFSFDSPGLYKPK